VAGVGVEVDGGSGDRRRRTGWERPHQLQPDLLLLLLLLLLLADVGQCRERAGRDRRGEQAVVVAAESVARASGQEGANPLGGVSDPDRDPAFQDCGNEHEPKTEKGRCHSPSGNADFKSHFLAGFRSHGQGHSGRRGGSAGTGGAGRGGALFRTGSATLFHNDLQESPEFGNEVVVEGGRSGRNNGVRVPLGVHGQNACLIKKRKK